MFLFSKRKEKKLRSEVTLFAPVNGRIIGLEQVPDPVFANKMLGEGIAVELSGEVVRAPCDCKVVMVANTLHALGLLADNGAEILIHVGLDTTQLNGKGFSVLVSPEQEVKKGEPLILVEKDFIEENGYNLVTPMVITNSSEFSVEIIKQDLATEEEIQVPILVVGR